MSNIGPNMIHAMDLAHLENMNVTTNELGESVITTPDGDLTMTDIMVGMYGSELEPWQSEALKRLMAIDPKDELLRAERQELKIDTFVERYSNGSFEMKTAGSGYRTCSLQMEIEKGMIESLTGKKIDWFILDENQDIPKTIPFDWWGKSHHFPSVYRLPDLDFIPDDRDQHDWKRDSFLSGPETPPSDAKRAKLRSKRKKRK